MRFALRLAAVLSLAAAAPAPAALSGVSPSGFLVTHRTQTSAPSTAIFEALGQPARWWSAQHTYSGNAANLRMRLAAGGCFCEGWERNAIEHARVIAVMPPRLLRLQGALGPLQAMAVTGILDFALEPRGTGAALTVTYRVRGSPDAALDKIAPAVDKVIGEQVERLVALVDTPAANAKPAKPTEQSFESEGTRIRFLEQGSGEPVILLHDAGKTSEAQWVDTGVMRALAERSRAIAVDARRPGDVLRLMDHLGIPKAHLVGYGEGAQLAAKIAVDNPSRVHTLTLAGSTSLRKPRADGVDADLVVPDAAMIALTVPTLGIMAPRDPAVSDFVELKRVMPRLVRMVTIEGTDHDTAVASPDFVTALTYFLRYNPMS